MRGQRADFSSTYVLLSAAILCAAFNASIVRAELPRQTTQLHSAHRKDGSAAFKVFAKHGYSRKDSVFAAVTHRAEKVRIFATLHELESIGEPPVVFDQTIDRTWSHRGTTGWPFWSGGIVYPDFTLPSARLFVDSDDANRVLLVVFDGERIRSYQYDAGVKRFVAANPRDREHRQALRAMFREGFAPEDVYWSYALVTHAGFFGYKAPQPDPGKLRPPDTVADLYGMWKRAESFE